MRPSTTAVGAKARSGGSSAASPAAWVTNSASAAVGQRSLGDPSQTFALFPVLSEGCPSSSGEEMQYPLEIDYDYDRIDPTLFDQAPGAGLERWAPLLPPLKPGLSLGEGGTALVAMPELSSWLGLKTEIYLKDESRNPTWSHKDRLNLCTVSAASATGTVGIAVASSGNHGVAAAAYAARAGLRCILVTSPGSQPGFIEFAHALGAHIVVVPTERRWPVLREIVARTGFMPMSNLTHYHTGNPFGPEGYKTIAYELFLQLGRRIPGTVVIPTGYGELLYGVWKGFFELQRLGLTQKVPAILSAEPDTRGPLAQAVRRNVPAAEVAARPSSVPGIACTVSSVRGALAIRNSLGRALTFDETVAAQARALLARQGLWQEVAGVAGLAAIRGLGREAAALPGPVVTILTSTGLKDLRASIDHVRCFGEDALGDLFAEVANHTRTADGGAS